MKSAKGSSLGVFNLVKITVGSEFMEANLEVADAIENNDLNKAYDEYCKKILSNKQILAHIMKECVAEYRDIPVEEIPSYIENDPQLDVVVDDETDKIQGRNIEDQSVHGAEIKYDILFDAKLPNSDENERIGLFINLEAQNSNNNGYPLTSRAVYYCSRLLAKQKNMQGGFQNSEFQNLKKVYSIWIVMNPSKALEGVFNEYTISEKCLKKKYHIPKTDYDKLCVVMIYLNKEYDINDDKHDLTEMLYILFQADIPAQDKKYQLSENYGIMMTRAIDEEMDGVCNLSQGIMDKGIEKGLEKGLKKGIEKGHLEGQIQMASSMVISLMKTTNKSMSEVMDMADVDKAIRPEVEKAIKAMNQSI